jgi:hypothetical protein
VFFTEVVGLRAAQRCRDDGRRPALDPRLGRLLRRRVPDHDGHPQHGGFLTIFLVWLGHVAVTGAELYTSAASWALQAKLMDPEHRGEYGGVAEVFGTLGGRWAPAVYTFLAMSWHPAGLPGAGWLVIAGVAILAVAGLHPSTRVAERFLEREGIVITDEPPADGAEAAPMPSLAHGATGVPTADDAEVLR